MKLSVRSVDYFHGTIASDACEACQWLSDIAEAGVNLLAFWTNPTGPGHTQLTLFPDDADRFLEAVRGGSVQWIGPQKAFLVQGDDRLGAAAELYGKLADVDVQVFSSAGVTDGRGGFGYVLYVRPEDFDKARKVLID